MDFQSAVSAGFLVLLAIAPRPTTAQVPTGGRPFLVHSATGGLQATPGVVARGDGSFVVVWAGNTGVKSRRITADGRPIGEELTVRGSVNTWFSSVASGADGELVVVWNEEGVYPNTKLLARRVGADGQARGEGPFVVTELDYAGHDVALSPDGAFSVVWSDWSGAIRVRTFDAADAPSGEGESPIGGSDPAIAVGEDGNPIVVWRTWGRQGSQILGQRFTSTGQRLGADIEVSIDLDRTAWEPDVSMSSDGAFVVVWNQSAPGHHEARESREVAGQRFNRDGVRVGPRFVVHEENLGGQFLPTVALGRSGEFFMVWASLDDSGLNERLYGQAFDPASARVGPTIEIATGVGADPRPVVALAPSGARFVAWQSPHPSDVYGVFLAGDILGDGDGDGIRDANDNCPTIANDDQADEQADGYGDACVSPDVVLPADLRLGANPIVGVGTTLAEKIEIGDRVHIGEHVSLGARVRAGHDLRVDDFAVIGAGTVLGDRVAIATSARTEGAVTIEDDVTIGERAVLKRRVKVGAAAVIEPWVVIFAGATVGPGATIETGARIGRLATVSPGAIVTAGTTVPAGTVFP